MAGGAESLAEFIRDTEGLPPLERAQLRQQVFDAKLRPQWATMTEPERLFIHQSFNAGLERPLQLMPVEGTYTKQMMGEIRPWWGREPDAPVGEQVFHVLEGARRGLVPPSLDKVASLLGAPKTHPGDPRSQGGILPPWMHLPGTLGKDVANATGWTSEPVGELLGSLSPAIAPLLMKFPRLAAPLTNFLRSQMRSPILEGWQAGRAARGARPAAAAPEMVAPSIPSVLPAPIAGGVGAPPVRLRGRVRQDAEGNITDIMDLQ